MFTEALMLDNTNIDAKFYRAVSNLDYGQIKESITELNEVLAISPTHSQITYILLSIAYKRNNDINKAI